MRIIQAIEVEYYAIRALHSQDGEFGGRLFATGIVAAQLLPVLFTVFEKYGLFNSELRIWIAFAASFLFMYILIDRRRERITATYGQGPVKFDQRAKLSLAAFLILSTFATAAIAGVSPILALVAFGVFAMTPLQRWVRPISHKNGVREH